MLRKKYLVQKSLRLDGQLSEDLEILSEILERPQNELMNLAIEKLILDNQSWFAHNIIVDYLNDFINNGREEEIFEMQDLHLKAKCDLDDKITLYSAIRDGTKVVDEFTYEFDDMELFKKKLRELTMYLDLNGEDVKNYLKGRLNYK